jgi:hypothetical protein
MAGAPGCKYQILRPVHGMVVIADRADQTLGGRASAFEELEFAAAPSKSIART